MALRHRRPLDPRARRQRHRARRSPGCTRRPCCSSCWSRSPRSTPGCSASTASPGACARSSTTRCCCSACCARSSSPPRSTRSATRAPAATAARRPGVMGVGLYLVWPAFYCDVTDAYRLGRAGPPAHRSRRRLLQRHLRARGGRGVLRHRAGGAAADRLRPAHDRAPAAAAAAALRRLLRPQRPHGRAGHPVADQADLPLARARAATRARRSRSSSRGCASSSPRTCWCWCRRWLFMIVSTVIGGAAHGRRRPTTRSACRSTASARAPAAPEVALGAFRIGALVLPIGAIAAEPRPHRPDGDARPARVVERERAAARGRARRDGRGRRRRRATRGGPTATTSRSGPASAARSARRCPRCPQATTGRAAFTPGARARVRAGADGARETRERHGGRPVDERSEPRRSAPAPLDDPGSDASRRRGRARRLERQRAGPGGSDERRRDPDALAGTATPAPAGDPHGRRHPDPDRDGDARGDRDPEPHARRATPTPSPTPTATPTATADPDRRLDHDAVATAAPTRPDADRPTATP